MPAINYNRSERERESWARCGPWRCHPEVLNLITEWLELQNIDRRGNRQKRVLHRDDAINYLFFNSVAGMRRDVLVLKDAIRRAANAEKRRETAAADPSNS